MAVREKTSDVTADSVAAKIIETAPLIMYFIRRNARRDKRANSSIARVRLLAFLQNCPDSSLTSASESLGVTNATASALVETLVKGGLVERKSDPRERRRILLNLTKVGERELESARRARMAEIAAVLHDLPPQQLRQIEDGLSVLKDSFKQLGAHHDV